MPGEAEVEADVEKCLTVLKILFEKPAKGSASKWTEDMVNRDLLKKAVAAVHRRYGFNVLNYGDSLSKIREVSLLCSKIHELKPFTSGNYLGKKDINACLNSMYFYYTVSGIYYRELKEKSGENIKMRHRSPDMPDRLYQNFLAEKLSERDLMRLAEIIGQTLYASTPRSDKPK